MRRTKSLAIVVAALAATAFAASAATSQVTFTKDILPILQENCQTCHRAGGDNVAGMVAPMSLMTYEETRPWAKAIARNVLSGKMPPWFAAEEQDGVFHNERKLPQENIDTILTWLNTGIKRGHPQDAPAPIEFHGTDGWLAGIPDIVLTMPEPYFVPDELEDQYVNFTTDAISEELLPFDRWLRTIEWRGDSDVVHHIVGSATVIGPDGEETRFELGSIAPGEEATEYPEGYGKLLRKGSRINFNVHYHKEAGPGTGKWDQSMVGFQFWDEETDPPVLHPVHRNGITNRFFEIPPGHAAWPVGASKTFDTDTTILSLHPHMHLRGKDCMYTAIYPDGRREVILEVPAFDFNWQLDYTFKEPMRVPAGTRIEFITHYDNSVDNIYNPDATIPMVWGGPTTSEMMIGYISYCDTEPIDPDSLQSKTGSGD